MNNDTALNLGWTWIALCSITVAINWVVSLYQIIPKVLKKIKTKCSSKKKVDKVEKIEDVENFRTNNNLNSGNKINDALRTPNKNQPKRFQEKVDEEDSINVVGDNAIGFDFNEERKVLSINANNVNVTMNYNKGHANINQGRNFGTNKNISTYEGLKGNNSSDGSDQFGYEDGTTIGSNKRLPRKTSDPIQVKVKRFDVDNSASSDRNILFRPQRLQRENSLHEESKELPERSRRRIYSDEKNISMDSSNSIPGLDNLNNYGSNEIEKKLDKELSDSNKRS